MADDHWGERQDEFDRHPTRTGIKALFHGWLGVVVAIVLIGLIGVGMWYFRVHTSDIKGTGDAEIIKNEARNRIRAQEGFEAKYAGVEAADKNIQITYDALKAKPGDLKLSTELNGQKMVCNDLVAQYNASARKFSDQEFRAADLPQRIEDTNPATNCKEN